MKSIVSNKEELLEVAEDDRESVKEEVESLQERYNELKANVSEKLAQTEKVDNVIDKVRRVKGKQANLCGDIGRKLDFLEPIGNDVEKAKVQAEEIEVEFQSFYC